MEKHDRELRQHERFRLKPNFGFLCSEAGEEYICMLRDISCGGVSAEILRMGAGNPLPRGAKIHFDDFPESLNAVVSDRNGTVVWNAENRMGVRFHTPIILE